MLSIKYVLKMYRMLMSNVTRGVIGLKKGTQAEVCHWCSYIYGPSLKVEFICETEHTNSKYFSFLRLWGMRGVRAHFPEQRLYKHT